ncbi:MAG: hypothetical protein R3B09_32230, partial [Nannocystaceae bacterium]
MDRLAVRIGVVLLERGRLVAALVGAATGPLWSLADPRWALVVFVAGALVAFVGGLALGERRGTRAIERGSRRRISRRELVAIRASYDRGEVDDLAALALLLAAIDDAS